MSITEAQPDFSVRPTAAEGFPFSDNELHQHVLARILYAETEEIHLAGISASAEGGAALLDYAIDIDGELHHPSPNRKFGMIVVREFTPITLRGVKVPEDILKSIPRMNNINKLKWTPASAVIGVMKGNRALIAGRETRER